MLSEPVLTQTLRRAHERRRSLWSGGDTTGYRAVHGEADDLPALSLDWFSGVAVVNLYEEISPGEEAELVRSVANALHPKSIYVKRKPRSAHSANRNPEKFAPELPAFGEPVPEIVVLENALRFAIRPPNGLSVGLYLDMRDVRQWLRAHSRGARVLNCFAYTCGFAVAAKAGGARQVVNVDISKKVLAWGAQNAKLNGQSAQADEFIAEEAFHALKRLDKRNEKFDVVVLDPPSFSSSKKRAFSVARDYPALIASSAKLCGPGATLVACCNQASISRAKFRTLMNRGLKAARRPFELQEELGPSPVDFPPSGDEPALKVSIIGIR